jgi:hypothetical protein
VGKPRGIVADKPEKKVAFRAQQTTDAPGLMVMVNVHAASLDWDLRRADGTTTLLTLS